MSCLLGHPRSLWAPGGVSVRISATIVARRGYAGLAEPASPRQARLIFVRDAHAVLVRGQVQAPVHAAVVMLVLC